MPVLFNLFAQLFLVFALTGVGNAITFDEVPLGTSDPTIEGVSFWAGNPISWNDTYTDDGWSPGNPYLASGYDDGTGNSPGLYDTFIEVSLTGLPFASCSFDILSEYSFPPSTTLWRLRCLRALRWPVPLLPFLTIVPTP